MADQILPINNIDQTGMIKDASPVALPPNAFSDARNVRFKDGNAKKMEGEVNIFPHIFDDSTNLINGIPANFDGSTIKYILWWANPNLAVFNKGYYLVIAEETRLLSDNSKPPVGNTDTTHQRDVAYLVSVDGSQKVEKGFFEPVGIGEWQHTFFQGGFALIINNRLNIPQYILDKNSNTDITLVPEFSNLPGWDSYEVNQVISSDAFDADSNDYIYDLGQNIDFDLSYIEVTYSESGTTTTLTASGDTGANGTANNEGFSPPALSTLTTTPWTTANEYEIYFDISTNTTVINLPTNLTSSGKLKVAVKSRNPVYVSCGIIRAFGDFLVAGNLVERNEEDLDSPIIRNLNGVVRTSDAAAPGSIPNNWNPFAVGVSTADEFVVANTGVVQDMVEMQGNLYIYTNGAISVMRLTGNASVPLTITPVTKSYGCQTTNAVIEFNGQHFVVGSQDIYLFGGHPGSIQSISDGRVRKYFFDTLNPLHNQHMFCLLYQQRDEIWVCYPTIDSTTGECDRALIFNYRNNTWTSRDLRGVVSGNVGPFPGGGIPATDMTFSGQSGNSGVINVGAQEVRTIGIDASTVIQTDKVFYSDTSNDLMYGIGRNGDVSRVETSGSRPFFESLILPAFRLTGPEGIDEIFTLEDPTAGDYTPIEANYIMDQISEFFTNEVEGWSASGLPLDYQQRTDNKRLVTTVNSSSKNLNGNRPVDDSIQFEVTKVSDGNILNNTSLSIDLVDSTETGVVYGLTTDMTNDYRGIGILRATPTHVALLVSNDSHPSGQELIIVNAGDEGDYDPFTHTGTQNGESLTGEQIAEQVIARLRFISFNLNVIDAGTNGEIKLQPADYSDINNFLIDIRINDTQENTDWIYDQYLKAQRDEIGYNNSSDPLLLNPVVYGAQPTLNVHSIAPDVAGSLDSVLNPDPTRSPNRVTTQTTASTAVSLVSSRIFDIDRPWSQEEINPNYEVPLFASRKVILDENSVEYIINKILAADIGWTIPTYSNLPRTEVENTTEFRLDISNNDEPIAYESYIERKQLPVSPEFNVQTIQRLVLWAQGSYRPYVGSPEIFNRLQVRMAGTDNPGQDYDLSDVHEDEVIHNNFFISEDYRVGMRVNGRFLNFRISDTIHDHDNGGDIIVDMTTNPNSTKGLTYSQASDWQVSSIQAEINNDGER